jgi:hypothetical protein
MYLKELDQSFLNRGPWIDFRGSVNLDAKKIITLFSVTSN